VRKEAGVSPPEGSVGEYNRDGAGGTYVRVEPKEGMVVVYMDTVGQQARLIAHPPEEHGVRRCHADDDVVGERHT
jgi:CubicO group peptidase (beta-lactamase class C family)